MLSVIFWPLRVVWSFFEMLCKLLGSILALTLGIVFIVVGVLLCLTVVGALVGVPLIIAGAMMAVRSLF